MKDKLIKIMNMWWRICKKKYPGLINTIHEHDLIAVKAITDFKRWTKINKSENLVFSGSGGSIMGMLEEEQVYMWIVLLKSANWRFLGIILF